MFSLPLLINLLIKVLIYIINIDDIYTKCPISVYTKINRALRESLLLRKMYAM